MSSPSQRPADLEPPETAASGHPITDLSRRTEWLIGGAIAALSVALTAYLARNAWFTHDEWEFILHRTAFDIDSLVRPFGGHWTTWSTLLLRGLFQGFGLDYWPWYFIPRLIGHTLLALLIWRVVRRRGAHPAVSPTGLAVLLVLEASFYQRALQVGNWVVYAALILSALIIDQRRDDPTITDRVLVGALLFGAALGNGYSVAVIGGIGLTLLVQRRLVAWLPSLVPVMAAYSVWYLYYRDDLRQRPESFTAIVDMPLGMFRLLRTAMASVTGLPSVPAAVLVVALLAAVVLLIRRGRFDTFDWIVASTLATGLVLLNLQRVAYDPDAADRLRYSYSIIVLLILLLVPHVPRPTSLRHVVVLLVVGAGLVFANADGLHTQLAAQESDGSRQARLVAAALELVAAGEPVVATSPAIVRGLDSDDLARLVETGQGLPALDPDDPTDDDAFRFVRGSLRIDVITQTSLDEVSRTFPTGPPPQTGSTVTPAGCVLVFRGSPVILSVTDAALLESTKAATDILLIRWSDAYGQGWQTHGLPFPRAIIALAEPDEEAEVTLEAIRGRIEVCGVAPEDHGGT